MKKLLSVILVAVILLSCIPALSVSALESVNVITSGTEEELSFLGVLKDGRTLVPADDIANALEATLSFDEETQTITIATEDKTIICTLVLDNPEAKIHATNYTLDVPAQIIDSKIMVPARFVAEAFSYKVDWVAETKTVIITKINLTRDIPDSEGKKAVIANARQLTEITYTPLKDLPIAISSTQRGVFEAGKEYKGIPYSSCESYDKFVGENVSLETFLSALANPDSVLYTKDLYAQPSGATYYGTVCNGLVRYSIGIKERYNTQKFLTAPGMKIIGRSGKYTVDQIELCDILHAYGQGRNHVALITGILRNEAGEVVRIEVSEAVRSSCKRRTFDLETFFEYYKLFSLVRYKDVDTKPVHDEELDKLIFETEFKTPEVAVDYGNKSNYLEGQTTVISVFAEGDNTLQIIKDDVVIEEIEVTGVSKFERTLSKGYYKVKLDGSEEYAEFCVCKPEISHTMNGNVITITVSSGDEKSKIHHMDFRLPPAAKDGWHPLSRIEELTEEEKASGIIERTVNKNYDGNYKISFENEYGIWTHQMIGIEFTK